MTSSGVWILIATLCVNLVLATTGISPTQWLSRELKTCTDRRDLPDSASEKGRDFTLDIMKKKATEKREWCKYKEITKNTNTYKNNLKECSEIIYTYIYIFFFGPTYILFIQKLELLLLVKKIREYGWGETLGHFQQWGQNRVKGSCRIWSYMCKNFGHHILIGQNMCYHISKQRMYFYLHAREELLYRILISNQADYLFMDTLTLWKHLV